MMASLKLFSIKSEAECDTGKRKDKTIAETIIQQTQPLIYVQELQP